MSEINVDVVADEALRRLRARVRALEDGIREHRDSRPRGYTAIRQIPSPRDERLWALLGDDTEGE